MTVQRTGVLLAFLMLLAPATALPVMKLNQYSVTQVNTVTTELASTDSTITNTDSVMQTYYGSSRGMMSTVVAANFTNEVVGFLAPKGKCSVYSLPEKVSSGTMLNVLITATHPVNLYLFSTQPPGGWPAKCNLNSTSILTVGNFTEFNLRWTAPQDGTYYFVFTGPNAVILLFNQGSMKWVEETGTLAYPTRTETILSLNPSTTTVSYLEVKTMVMTMTVTNSLYAEATSPYGTLSFALIAMLLAMMFLTVRRPI